MTRLLESPGVILAQRVSRDGKVTWQARRSPDRGRLQVVGIVAPSAEPTEIEPLTDAELRELLTSAPPERPERWLCRECGASNEPGRRWCRFCSSHTQ